MTSKEKKIQRALGTLNKYIIQFWGPNGGLIGTYCWKDALVEHAIQYVYKYAGPWTTYRRIHRAHKNHNCIIHVTCGSHSSLGIPLCKILNKNGDLLGKRRRCKKTFVKKYLRGIE